MHRFFAFCAALTLTALAVTSSCLASTSETVRVEPHGRVGTR
jgi:hypothetical protein